MSEYKFKNLSEIDTVEAPADGTTMMGFENGVPIQMPMGAVKGSGGVFIIDAKSPDYKPTDMAYGDAVKDALLGGKAVWVRIDDSSYAIAYRMSVGSNCGQSMLYVYFRTGGQSESTLPLYISDIRISTDG